MKILGISGFYHDSAAALVVDGEIIAAAQEERFTRIRHDAGFPSHAIRYCLQAGSIQSLNEIDRIVFYDKPFLKFERILETYLAFAPKGFTSFKKSIPLWIKEKLFQKKLLRQELKKIDPKADLTHKLLFCEHHLSHAASAFYPSPFQEAAVLTMDGVGEWSTTSVALGEGNSLDIQKEIYFPHSIGLLYSAFTYHLGFKVNSGEYKVMGLAPYGEPRFAQKILDELIDLKEDGSFRLNLEYFDYCVGLTMVNGKFAQYLGIPRRTPETALTPVHMDLAASIQKVTEEIVLRLARSLRKETGKKNLCLAGGVALNCVANGKIMAEKIFDEIWIQPAAGDAGGALGAALYAYYSITDHPRIPHPQDSMKGGYLGPNYEHSEIRSVLDGLGAKYELLSEDELIAKVSGDLIDQKAIGWFQGRMEFGPRALGARSIIADPRSPDMQKKLNLKVKYRESFRPFAPAVLEEESSAWFDIDRKSPYMLLVTQVQNEKRIEMTDDQNNLFGINKLNVPRSSISAVTHVDYSARVQTVDGKTHPKFHGLLRAFQKRTGCPNLINTSFNVRGEPIVCSPADAFKCFMGTEIETLVIENFYLDKAKQDPALRSRYETRFELD